MRIGQLARRLGVPPTEILGFLGTNNIDADAGPNSRLSDEDVTRVVSFFAPDKLSEILAVEVPAAEEIIVEEPVVIEQPPVVEQAISEEPAPEPEAPIEVIRVSKVELQGLKVLGKIDLPEKKKAEPVAQPEEQQQQQSQPRREFQKRTDRREREWRNPLEAKRQQEAREAEKQKQEAAERLKEKRTNHYYNKVKSVPTKAVRRVQEEVVVEDIEMKESPKGLFGRFLKWLRT